MGDSRPALRLLHRVALMGVCFSPGQDSDFTSLRPLPLFHDIIRTFENSRLQRGGSTLAFSLREKGLITERIAYNPGDRSEFVSSVRKRTIYRRDTTGHINAFVPSGSGLSSLIPDGGPG